MKIAFLSNKLTLRGCEMMLYNYAHYNEIILKNKSIIITRDIEKIKDENDVHPDAYKKFNTRFPTFYYENNNDVENILKQQGCDIIFIEKAGSRDDKLLFNSCKNIIHSVFTLEEPHGEAFTTLSHWMNKFHYTNYPVIPYMVEVYDTNENLRKELNIPDDALVFGTYSGYECFNIDYIKQCVKDIKHDNIYFIFMNIKLFMDETSHVRFLAGTASLEYKRKFINTCDAMLYGRDGGETFGLACGEFSLCDKPIIARSSEHSSSHLDILDDKIIKHNNYDELYHILTHFKEYNIDVSTNGYKKYTPEYSMKCFQDICDSLFKYKTTKKVYFNGFWSGFFERTNPVHVDFFIKLLEDIFQENIVVGNIDDSDILFETIFEESKLDSRSWKYTFLFSGESRLNKFTDRYNIVFCSKKNSANIINVPEFIPYLYCNYSIDYLENKDRFIKEENKSPIAITSIISNPSFNERNFLLQTLMQQLPIANFGSVMNNVGGKLQFEYNTLFFNNFLKQFKFILAFENSIDETYITEKVFHGLLSGIIPIYYGSKNITDYINKERIIIIEDLSESSIKKVINKIQYLLNNKEAYDAMIRKPIFTNGKLSRTLESIIQDSRNILFNKFPQINKIFCVCNETWEPVRMARLETLFKSIEMNVTYLSRTYKNTITKETYDTYVKTDEIFTLRNTLTKKAELSLTLNFLEVFRTIRKNYSSGIFLTLESDVYLHNDIENLNLIIKHLDSTTWDCVHIGYDKPNLVEHIGFERKFTPRGTDSMLWTYDGILKFLNYLENELVYDFSVPYDYIFWNFLKKHDDFYFYWSNPIVFIQGTNAGMEESTIQKDLV